MIAIVAMEAAAPAEAGVRAFLAGIYAGYARRGGHGAVLTRPAALFEPALAAAVTHGHLDFDPFCAGQDWTPFVATIGPVGVTGNRASAIVHFTNGRPVTIRFTLVHTPAGWRIFEMSGTDLPSLRAAALHHPPRRVGDDAVD